MLKSHYHKLYYFILILPLYFSYVFASAFEVLLAVDKGDIGFIKGYLFARGDVNEVDEKNRTLLQRAAARGHLDIVETLLEKGADVNQTDDVGKTPLYEAILGRHLEVAQMLMQNGADVNHQEVRQMTALHMACHKGYIEGVDFLLRQDNIQIDLINCKGQTPFSIAALNANRAFVEESEKVAIFEKIAGMLMEKGANVNVDDSTQTSLLHWSVYDGHLSMVEKLLRFGAKVNAQRDDGTTPRAFA